MKTITTQTIYVVIFTLTFLCEVSAQRLRPFQIIEFSGLNPDWIVPVKDTVLAENTTIGFIDEYNSISNSSFLPEVLIHGDFIFHVMKIGGGIPLGGSLIDCRDLQTGKLVWQKRYGIYADSIEAAIRIMKIDSDGNLLVMGQRRKHPLDSPLNATHFTDMVLFEDIYNIETGELIRSSDCDYELGTIMPTLFSPYEGGTSAGAFLLEGDNYRNIEYRRYGQDKFLRSFVLNKCGELMSDTFKIQVYDNIDNVNLIEIGPDTIMVLSKKYLRSDSLFSFNFKYYNRELVLLDSVLTDSFPNYMLSQKILGLSKDKKKILIRWDAFENGSTTLIYPQKVAVFDLKGKLLKIANLPASRFLNPLALEWEDDSDNITIIQTDFIQQNAKSAQTYLKTSVINDLTGETEDITIYKVKDSLQVGFFSEILHLHDNKLLMTGVQLELYIKTSGNIAQDSDGFSTFLMLVDKDKFTKPVSSEDVVDEDEFAPIVFPNPGLDGLNISWQQSFTGHIQIVDMTGKIVHKEEVKNTNHQNLDSFTWPSGLYGIHIYDESRQMLYKYKWVKN